MKWPRVGGPIADESSVDNAREFTIFFLLSNCIYIECCHEKYFRVFGTRHKIFLLKRKQKFLI